MLDFLFKNWTLNFNSMLGSSLGTFLEYRVGIEPTIDRFAVCSLTVWVPVHLVGSSGFEPLISSVSEMCFHQLSYKPLWQTLKDLNPN